MKKEYWVTALVVILVGGISFYGGMRYEMMKGIRLFTAGNGGGNAQFGQFRRGQNGQAGGTGAAAGRQGGGSAGGMRPVMGSILDQDDKSLTIKMLDGSTKIVLLSDTTAINKSTAGSRTDLTNGQQVVVFGTTNSDGSVTALNVSLGSTMMGTKQDQSSGSATQK